MKRLQWAGGTSEQKNKGESHEKVQLRSKMKETTEKGSIKKVMEKHFCRTQDGQ